MTTKKAKRPRPDKGYRWVEVGEILKKGDQTQDIDDEWFDTVADGIPCDEEFSYRRPIPPHKGESETACYEDQQVGDRPEDLAAIEQRDARDRIYEAACVLIVCEHVNRCRAVLQRPDEDEARKRQQLSGLEARLREDLEVALLGAQAAAEVAYPAPTQPAQEVVV